jgi:hypothetical protein
MAMAPLTYGPLDPSYLLIDLLPKYTPRNKAFLGHEIVLKPPSRPSSLAPK